MDDRPIGVFDSGLGGLTAISEIIKQMPNEDIIYFGDTGRVPYGSRSKEIIIKYARQDIKFLMSFDIKAIVVACGTVSSTALDVLKPDYKLPIIGVVQSAARDAAMATKNGKIGVIGTQGTISSGAYTKTLSEIDRKLEITETACPLFVPLVENGRFQTGDVVATTVAKEYLEAFSGKNIDTLILGCTHYPLLRGIISEILGDGVCLIDSGASAIKDISKILKGSAAQAGDRAGEIKYFVSDDPENFFVHAKMFMGRAMCGEVSKIEIDKY